MSSHSAPSDDEAPGLYLHVPFCASKCGYCAFYSQPTAGRDMPRLVSALLEEAQRYQAVPAVRTIYIGGGSPTSLPADQLARLVETVASTWPNAEEFTVECNPGQANIEMLSMLACCGVNRLSFGVQSFHRSELELLGRRHSADEAVRSVRQAQDLGFTNVGIDLIFAVPGSTLDSWQRSLESAISLGMQHISAYSLSFEPGTPLYEARRLGRIDSIEEDTDRAMYELAIDLLAAAGFVQYEISNFAREGFECRHNMGCWENRPYIGIGPSAASYWRGERTANVADIDAYISRIEAGRPATEQRQQPDRDDCICETAVLNLRTRRGVNLADFQRRTGADFRKVFATPLRRHEREGLIEAGAGQVRLARRALAVADSVLCDFSSL
ncbi:MAG: radical SAM family heme chaperone HemW [Sedimentisphaerales bacterium]|nr:radical SAM family heme chaperone HemW [Sedimentisphaerales bacterium]NLT75635.1 radical SAM family heme chaperone HemW [Planctomycetota bacterium]